MWCLGYFVTQAFSMEEGRHLTALRVGSNIVSEVHYYIHQYNQLIERRNIMTTITLAHTSLRALGTVREHKEGAAVALAMLLVTLLYESAASYMPDYAFSVWAFVGVWTGLTTVWLTRTENILCWPWGIVSAAAFGWFFGEIGLLGQQWLNWGFFLTVQVWAWYHWVSGGKDEGDLPVTRMSWGSRTLYLVLIALGTWLVYSSIGYFAYEPKLPLLDALVVASSVVAQYLLGKKKVESWVLWLGPVNIISIYLFYMTGAYVVTALYIAFLIHAVFALRTWWKASAT
jgi:nicotinamide mononucleotide transporter